MYLGDTERPVFGAVLGLWAHQQGGNWGRAAPRALARAGEGVLRKPRVQRSSPGQALGQVLLLLSPRAATWGVSTWENYRQLQMREANVRVQPCLLWGMGMQAGHPSWEPWGGTFLEKISCVGPELIFAVAGGTMAQPRAALLPFPALSQLYLLRVWGRTRHLALQPQRCQGMAPQVGTWRQDSHGQTRVALPGARHPAAAGPEAALGHEQTGTGSQSLQCWDGEAAGQDPFLVRTEGYGFCPPRAVQPCPKGQRASHSPVPWDGRPVRAPAGMDHGEFGVESCCFGEHLLSAQWLPHQ